MGFWGFAGVRNLFFGDCGVVNGLIFILSFIRIIESGKRMAEASVPRVQGDRNDLSSFD